MSPPPPSPASIGMKVSSEIVFWKFLYKFPKVSAAYLSWWKVWKISIPLVVAIMDEDKDNKMGLFLWAWWWWECSPSKFSRKEKTNSCKVVCKIRGKDWLSKANWLSNANWLSCANIMGKNHAADEIIPNPNRSENSINVPDPASDATLARPPKEQRAIDFFLAGGFRKKSKNMHKWHRWLFDFNLLWSLFAW